MTITIKKDKAFYQYAGSFILLALVASIAGTFLRISLLLIYPVIAVLIIAFYRFRISSSLLLLGSLAGLGFLLSFTGHPFLKYKLLSLYYMFPFLILLFTNPVSDIETRRDSLSTFIKCLTAVAFLNDGIGLVQIMINPQSDDSLLGIYTQFSVSVNGLMLLNTFLLFYYFVSYLYKKKTVYLIFALFFLGCSVLGFYGAGLVICLASFVLSFFQFRLKVVLRTFGVAVLSLASVYILLYLIKPVTLEYNIANLNKIVHPRLDGGPRKLISFYNYAVSYPKNAKDFLFGSGPGTFNSRSAFMVGSPSYFTEAPFIKDPYQPYYFQHYAYPLWNETNTAQRLYLDGFRNQPFSSLLALLGEYGIVFTMVLALIYIRYYYRVAGLYEHCRENRDARVKWRFFKFLMILLPLLLLIDNYLEYPEIMLLILPGIKFSHAGLLYIRQNPMTDEYP